MNNLQQQQNKAGIAPPFAIIDMGSNSFRLCIFDDSKSGASKKLKYIDTCQMGEGFHENLEIQPAPFKRCVKACENFIDICKEYGVLKIYAFATATLREAYNREDFIRACKALSLDIHILSGEEEALCGFLGACAGLNCKDAKVQNSDVAVLDIGGASTELAIGNIRGFKGLFQGATDFPTLDEIKEKSKGTLESPTLSPVKFAHSFKVGAVRLTDKFGEDFESEKEFLSEVFASFQNQIDLSSATLLGIGGTITSLCGLIKNCENFNPQLHGFSARSEDLRSLSLDICSMSKKERESLPHLKEKRKKIIASGSVLLSTALNLFNAKNITASLTDNLEGYRIYLGI